MALFKAVALACELPIQFEPTADLIAFQWISTDPGEPSRRFRRAEIMLILRTQTLTINAQASSIELLHIASSDIHEVPEQAVVRLRLEKHI